MTPDSKFFFAISLHFLCKVIGGWTDQWRSLNGAPRSLDFTKEILSAIGSRKEGEVIIHLTLVSDFLIRVCGGIAMPIHWQGYSTPYAFSPPATVLVAWLDISQHFPFKQTKTVNYIVRVLIASTQSAQQTIDPSHDKGCVRNGHRMEGNVLDRAFNICSDTKSTSFLPLSKF